MTSSGFMTSKDPIVVKRKYLKPIPPDPEFEQEKAKLNKYKWTARYNTILRGRKCITCNNMATQLLCSDMDGITFIEKYCDACASKLNLKL
jgi:hypothetical protein